MIAFKFKLAGIFLSVFVLAGMISCTRTSKMNDDKSVENTEAVKIDEDNFNEKDEDLLNVDYKEFYDDLAPYGEWIEVTDKDIGLNMKKESSVIEKPHKTISVAELLGVKDAYATGVAFGAFFIWQPSPNLAISVVAGEPEPYYVPYSNGQWVYTDDGWYFLAPTHYEEIVHHYGRWVFSPVLGWVWVPGRVWAPAWVEWRIGFGYVAWEPIPPGVYFVNNIFIPVPVYEDRFIIVENRYFCEPYIYRYWDHGSTVVINQMTRVDGLMIRNNTVINSGPDVKVIEKDRGKNIEQFKINKVNDKRDEKFTGKEINSYSPPFSKFKNKDKQKSFANIKPDKFNTFDNAKGKAFSKNEITDKSGKNKSRDITNKDRQNQDKSFNRKNDNKNSGRDYKSKQKDMGNNNKSGKNDNKRYNGQNKDNMEKFSKKPSQGDYKDKGGYKQKGNGNTWKNRGGNDNSEKNKGNNNSGKNKKNNKNYRNNDSKIQHNSNGGSTRYYGKNRSSHYNDNGRYGNDQSSNGKESKNNNRQKGRNK